MGLDINLVTKTSKQDFKMISPKTNKGVGRPKKDNKRIYQVKTLLTEDEFKKLEDYSNTNNISKSKVLSTLISKLKGI
ncbi:hypothetical protein OZY38_02315 [Aliarcobacter cryaerophilus]|uniref:hypothetical protein n=1 Tax=Aliarcobacter cryaerophilus TaxID=28198 RepID=UPI003BAE4674